MREDIVYVTSSLIGRDLAKPLLPIPFIYCIFKYEWNNDECSTNGFSLIVFHMDSTSSPL